ncbi:cobalamin B12-binding domain-containing protein [Limibaculum sp. FT325]|uniref:cobalamin B12-binding domain-containing protein n=1 Tax=Thermohalobaculum sediminis TaxID=2939436 RepID=UPI0020BE8338|nr:cobalamin B12-binding domain-containing protein [Limibaculum sediminis]MCL5778613.1 cobalamin B12-binding domain-containing protein [Limibaculum sediminis]
MSATDDGAFGGEPHDRAVAVPDKVARPDASVRVPDGSATHTSVAAGARERRAGAARRLAATIERDIVPRLVESARRCEGADQVAAEVERLAGLLVQGDLGSARSLLRDANARGMAPQEMMSDLLAPAARRLGVMWEDDACDFSAVCLGVADLQRLMREFRGGIVSSIAPAMAGRRILLAATPGEHHVFGVEMAAEAFITAGWEVVCRPSASHAELVRIAMRDWFDVAGFSLAAERHAGALGDAIRALRRVSLNPGLVVIAGGPAACLSPEAFSGAGADWIALDAGAAIARAGEAVRG